MAKPMFLSVNGTGVPDPFGPGFSADIGRSLSDPWNDVYAEFMGSGFKNKFYWQPIGYPAATFPMNPSQKAAQAELSRQITIHEADGSCPIGYPLALSGYSQGAIAVGQFWRDQILNPKGAHHNRLADVEVGGIINFGDPIRSPGIAHGNEVAGFAVPKKLDGQTTGGIAGPGCLKPEETPDYLLSCALDGDLYAAAPVGDTPWVKEPEVGLLETRIYNFVLQGSWQTFLANVEDLADLFLMPVATIIAAAQAIFNGMKFLFAGPEAPHWQYGPFVPAMVDWLNNRV
jgi:hypothetical protein